MFVFTESSHVLFDIILNINGMTLGGGGDEHGGRVVTLSPPTSEIGVPGTTSMVAEW